MFSSLNFMEFLGFSVIIPLYITLVLFLISYKSKKGRFDKQNLIQKKA
jgi:hypothetical protein